MISPQKVARWIDGWDAMQSSYIPTREARFSAMASLLAARVPSSFRFLDLGCGPGSLSARLLARFPRSRSVAVDFDPVMLTIGPIAQARFASRLHWVEADLRTDAWASRLPRGRFHAAVSSTALHWLEPRQLQRVYREVRGLLGPGGVVLNGDAAPLAQPPGALDALLTTYKDGQRRDARRGRAPPDWQGWWRRLEREPGLRPLFEERARRFPRANDHEHEVTEADHVRILRAAGFREAGVLWRDGPNVVLGASVA